MTAPRRRDRRRLARAAARPRPRALRVEAARASRSGSPQIAAALRSFERRRRLSAEPGVHRQRSRPTILWDRPRPWWRAPRRRGEPRGAFGDIMDQAAFYELLAELDQFELVRLKERAATRASCRCIGGDEVVGAFAPDHESDESLTRARPAGEPGDARRARVHATAAPAGATGVDPASITHAIGCGEEAIGDRYQRGGGNVGEGDRRGTAGSPSASGIDVKSFCAAPVHALVVAARPDRGRHRGTGRRSSRAASLGKLGMKFEGALVEGLPHPRGRAGRHGGAARTRPTGRTVRSCGPTRSGACRSTPARRRRRSWRHSSARRSRRWALAIADIDTLRHRDPQPGDHRAAGRRRRRRPQLQDARRARRGARRARARATSPGSSRAHGMPGFSPTQGHIASRGAVDPARARARCEPASCTRTMLIAKGRCSSAA